MDNYNDVSYFKVPTDEECILNAVSMGKLIEENPSTIRLWGDMYEDFLYIKKINGRLTYTEASVPQFKFIKELIREKKFTHKQIYDHISKLGFTYAKYDGGIVNPEDPLGFQALAVALSLENKKELKLFLQEFMNHQNIIREEERKEREQFKLEIANIVDERVKDSLDDLKQYIDQKELDFKEHDTKVIDTLRNHMEESKKENNIESKKGFWGRIFGK